MLPLRPAPSSMFSCILFLAVAISVASAQNDNANVAMLCKQHPAFKSSFKPVLISSWTYPLSLTIAEQLTYLPRYSNHVYSPVDGKNPDKYKNLDLFHTAGFVSAPSFRIYFQRKAKVYLFVDVPDSKFDASKAATLLGWQREGWVKRTRGKSTITYGVHQTLTRPATMYAYVFSKKSSGADYIDVPQPQFIKERITGLKVPGSFNLWIAEADGKPSPPVGKFQGKDIRPNTQCPDALHNVWVTPDTNKKDQDTKGVMFRTWHPQWDPCFWCAYNHDHGSSPKHLMGYTPKFTYTAWKNDRQDESDRGFKGFVLRTSDHFIYFSLHGVQSSLRRTEVQFHTINLAVVDRRTKELYVDIQHKGNFGFQGVQLKNGGFMPINKAQEKIQKEQEAGDGPLNFRSINVIDINNLDKRFKFRKAVAIGEYEFWNTLPICTEPKNRKSLLEVQFKLVNTGIKSLKKAKSIVRLGRTIMGKFYKSTGLNRSISASELKIGSEFCPGKASGVFYTDPKGNTVLKGPGRNAVRQFIKPGFSMTLDGRFETVDSWVGLHLEGSRGFFVDFGYGIDPDMN